MRKNIVIVGAGGFGREVAWLIQRINANTPTWNLLGYVDDRLDLQGQPVGDYHVLYSVKELQKQAAEIYVVCAVGNPLVRKQLVDQLSQNDHIHFPVLIDPSVQLSESVRIGEGSILCAGSVLTVNITIAEHVIINLDCTVGHDVWIGAFTTVYPGVHISGNVELEKCTEIGTGTQILQGKRVMEYSRIGAGAAVVQDIPPRCTAVGVPAKPVVIEGNKSQKQGGGVKTSKFKLIIIGAGGHGRVVAELAELLGIYEKISFVDDFIQECDTNHRVIGTIEEVLKNLRFLHSCDVFVAIGDRILRRKLITKLAQAGLHVPSFVHPSAQIASDVSMGTGTVVMANAVIQTGCQIGDGVIVNTSATVDHDNRIGDYAHIAPGVHLSGSVHVGEDTWIGVGAVVRNGVKICPQCMIGAGAVVVDHILEMGTYVGVPAKMMDRSSHAEKIAVPSYSCKK